jgi:inward rectifier potassium channel
VPFLKHINKKAKNENETGLSAVSNLVGGRFLNRDGSPNIHVKGMGFFEKLNVYHTLLSMSLWRFLLIIVLFFISINIFFAGIYLWIGLNHLGGIQTNSAAERFGEAFFFSAQTFTTVGYGRISPLGFIASFVASLEALFGLLSFAIATGLMYGRFARPKAYIQYSHNAIIAPFKDGVALMIRLVPYTKNYLVNVEARLTVAMKVAEDDIIKTKFFSARLDISKASTLMSNWTLVHPIEQDSPLFGLKREDIAAAETEFLFFLEGFDESFSSTVVSRTSYTYRELVYGAKFKPMYHPSSDGLTTILYLDKLNDFEPATLSVSF